jgi:hypothetical protein
MNRVTSGRVDFDAVFTAGVLGWSTTCQYFVVEVNLAFPATEGIPDTEGILFYGRYF